MNRPKQQSASRGPAPLTSRRELLRRAGNGLGLLGLASLLHDEGLLFAAPVDAKKSALSSSAINPLAPRPPHFSGQSMPR